MRGPIAKHLPHITLVRIGASDVALVDGLLDRLTDYSMLVEGVQKLADGARRLLAATPQGWSASSKYVFAVVADGETAGLIDLIDSFPSPAIVFIGLLAIVEDRHHSGLGRAAYVAVEDFARQSLRAQAMRLAVVDSNPVIGFWRRMGFTETGEVRPHKGECVTSQVRLMSKSLTTARKAREPSPRE